MECPSCALEFEPKADVCPYCGYEFPEEPKSRRFMAWVMALILIVPVLYILYRTVSG